MHAQKNQPPLKHVNSQPPLLICYITQIQVFVLKTDF